MKKTELEKTIEEQNQRIIKLESITLKLSNIVLKSLGPDVKNLNEKIKHVEGMTSNIDIIIKNTGAIMDQFKEEEGKKDERQEHYIG